MSTTDPGGRHRSGHATDESGMLAAAEAGNRLSKDEFDAIIPDLRVELLNAQFDLLEADFPLIILVAGDDRRAANDVVKRLHEWMDARQITTVVLGEPRPDEVGRPRGLRLWHEMPPRGRTGIWAGGLLRRIAARVAGEIDDAELERWLRHMEALRDQLLADGALFVKLFLHTPADIQRERLRRSKGSADGWRVDGRDWAILDAVSRERPLVEHFLRRTSTPEAPWIIVEATDARHRDITCARAIRDALSERLARAPAVAPAAPEALFSPAPGRASVLDGVDLSAAVDYEHYRVKLRKRQSRLHALSMRAREAEVPVVLVFEGWDAAGKGGVIRRVTQALEVGDYRVITIAAPTEHELRFHYLWRFWRALPAPGQFAVFDRSWYGRVLVERVERLTPPARWQRAYEEINDFEEQIVESGAVLCKFWLHISGDEQLRRFEARAQTPYKKYKLTHEDYRNRARREGYEAAVDQMVLRTSTDAAPWHLVSAEDKRHARLEVVRIVNRALKRTLRA
jgi:AMP-polyphosphate phosphotransferase